MIWKEATLLSLEVTGKDALNNDIKTEKEVLGVKGRFTPWSANDLALEDREVTVNQRKFLLRIKKKDYPKCDRVRVDGETYDIKNVFDLGRFVLLYVKRFK